MVKPGTSGGKPPPVPAGVVGRAGAHAAVIPARSIPPRRLRQTTDVTTGVFLLVIIFIAAMVVFGMILGLLRWRRYRRPSGPYKTAYVDAWKIAGERLDKF